jgi:hypothetical protein
MRKNGLLYLWIIKKVSGAGMSLKEAKEKAEKKAKNMFLLSLPIKFIQLEDFLSKELDAKVDLVMKDGLKLLIKEQVLKEVVYL